MGVAAGVVLAAGTGTRVGAPMNKAYLPLAGRPMLAWTLQTMTDSGVFGRLVLVIREADRAAATVLCRDELPGVAVELVCGGSSRHASEHRAVEHLAAAIDSAEVDVVVVQDAARPLSGEQMMRDAVGLARRHGAAVPATPVADLAAVDAGGRLTAGPPGQLMRVQTPQAFRAAPLLAAFRQAARSGFSGTDTASCLERFGDTAVRTFPGPERNIKVTYPSDIAVAERLLGAQG